VSINLWIGKDKDIFITKEDYENPEIREELIVSEDYGIMLPSGEINWDCPCLGGMAHGPCGEDFKSAFSCFVHSEAEVKGSDCLTQFQAMQDCMVQYPEIYKDEDQDDEENARNNDPAAIEPTSQSVGNGENDDVTSTSKQKEN